MIKSKNQKSQSLIKYSPESDNQDLDDVYGKNNQNQQALQRK